jgi:putative oxidoreductase
VVGLIFVAHGAQKLFGEGFGGVAGMMEGLGMPAPSLAAVALILVELLGGAALILGLFTRLAAVPLAFSMLVATLLVHLPNGFFSSSGGIEYTLLLTVACVALAMTGPGEAALDRALAWRGIPLTGEKVRCSKARPQETASGGDSTRSPYRVGDREKKQGFPSS